MKKRIITPEPPIPLPNGASLNTIVWLGEMNRRTRESLVYPAEYVDEIIDTACKCFGMDKADMLGRSKAAELHLPRKLAMWICVQKTKASLKTISEKFGRDHHTTVIHNRDVVHEMFEIRDEAIMEAWSKYKAFAPPYLIPAIPKKLKQLQ